MHGARKALLDMHLGAAREGMRQETPYERSKLGAAVGDAAYQRQCAHVLAASRLKQAMKAPRNRPQVRGENAGIRLEMPPDHKAESLDQQWVFEHRQQAV